MASKGVTYKTLSNDKFYKKGLKQIRRLTNMMKSAYGVKKVRGRSKRG